jgi:hypothetical protein
VNHLTVGRIVAPDTDRHAIGDDDIPRVGGTSPYKRHSRVHGVTRNRFDQRRTVPFHLLPELIDRHRATQLDVLAQPDDARARRWRGRPECLAVEPTTILSKSDHRAGSNRQDENGDSTPDPHADATKERHSPHFSQLPH